MNQNLKKIMDELGNDYCKDSHGQYHRDVFCELSFKDGFKAAIPHVREEILVLLRSKCFYDLKSGGSFADLIESELTKN